MMAETTRKTLCTFSLSVCMEVWRYGGMGVWPLDGGYRVKSQLSRTSFGKLGEQGDGNSSRFSLN